jgi:hypothetical protein
MKKHEKLDFGVSLKGIYIENHMVSAKQITTKCTKTL